MPKEKDIAFPPPKPVHPALQSFATQVADMITLAAREPSHPLHDVLARYITSAPRPLTSVLTALERGAPKQKTSPDAVTTTSLKLTAETYQRLVSWADANHFSSLNAAVEWILQTALDRHLYDPCQITKDRNSERTITLRIERTLLAEVKRTAKSQQRFFYEFLHAAILMVTMAVPQRPFISQDDPPHA